MATVRARDSKHETIDLTGDPSGVKRKRDDSDDSDGFVDIDSLEIPYAELPPLKSEAAALPCGTPTRPQAIPENAATESGQSNANNENLVQFYLQDPTNLIRLMSLVHDKIEEEIQDAKAKMDPFLDAGADIPEDILNYHRVLSKQKKLLATLGRLHNEYSTLEVEKSKLKILINDDHVTKSL